MNPKDIETIGEYIYGKQWIKPLARQIGVSDKMLAAYSRGKKPIPATLRGKISDAASTANAKRFSMIQSVEDTLRGAIIKQTLYKIDKRLG